MTSKNQTVARKDIVDSKKNKKNEKINKQLSLVAKELSPLLPALQSIINHVDIISSPNFSFQPDDHFTVEQCAALNALLKRESIQNRIMRSKQKKQNAISATNKDNKSRKGPQFFTLRKIMQKSNPNVTDEQVQARMDQLNQEKNLYAFLKQHYPSKTASTSSSK